MKKPNPYVRKIMVPVRVNADEMRELLKKAHQYAQGNISRFLRLAALSYKKPKG